MWQRSGFVVISDQFTDILHFALSSVFNLTVKASCETLMIH